MNLPSREEIVNTVIEDLLRDENDPDPTKSEFNKQWNEKVRQQHGQHRNIKNPFETKGNLESENDLYDEIIQEKKTPVNEKVINIPGSDSHFIEDPSGGHTLVRPKKVGQPTDISTSVGSPQTPPKTEPYVPRGTQQDPIITAQVKHDISRISPSSASRSTTSSVKNKTPLTSGRSLSDEVIKGAKNSNNLRTAGIAALLGAGAVGYSKMRNNEEERKNNNRPLPR